MFSEKALVIVITLQTEQKKWGVCMKTKKKKHWIWIVVVAVVIISLAATMSENGDSAEGNSASQIESTPSQEPSAEPETPTSDVGEASFDEIYKAYKENELVADYLYKHNRYRVTAKINGMTNDGLFNLTGGATLTLETRVDNTIVFFYAEFEKEQEENLKAVKVGDTITFVGECLSAGSWVNCELMMS